MNSEVNESIVTFLFTIKQIDFIIIITGFKTFLLANKEQGEASRKECIWVIYLYSIHNEKTVKNFQIS